MKSTGSLDGRVILVTGGGAGIGRGICLACAAEGARIVNLAPSRNGAETEAAVRAQGGTALWVQGDVTRAEDVDAAVARAVEVFGGLDGVVHNATSRHSGRVIPVQDLAEDVWQDNIAVSLRGAFNLAKAARPHLKPGRGRFVVMTSPAAMEGAVHLPAYAAVKGAMRGFAKSLAVEWGPLGIGVTVLSPLALTPALENAYKENPELEPRLRKLVPLGRVGDPLTDIAPVITFLVGDASRYVTGQTIIVDGGRFTTL
jgi:3-oxoacyl-[acyl-carrier protein] reductase